jgi:hypothetical protein
MERGLDGCYATQMLADFLEHRLEEFKKYLNFVLNLYDLYVGTPIGRMLRNADGCGFFCNTDLKNLKNLCG